jgi:hypothetical protein
MPVSSLSAATASARSASTLQRATIASIEGDFQHGLEVQYNPAQIQLEESASWTPDASRKDVTPALEFTGNASRTLSVELFFDGYEQRLDVKAAFVDPLGRLLQIKDPDGDEDRKRPPLIAFVWGSGRPAFVGVLASLSTKLTMFLPDGTPVRATCAVRILEATRASLERRRPANRVAAPRRA